MIWLCRMGVTDSAAEGGLESCPIFGETSGGVSGSIFPDAAIPDASVHFMGEFAMSKQSDVDNRSDQLNPNNDAYWQSRGEDGRPDDWEERQSEEI